MISATRLGAATAAVNVLSNRPEVTDWALRYFGPWWNATFVAAAEVFTEAVVLADVNETAYEETTLLVRDGRSTEAVDYAKNHILVARDGEDIIATSPDEGIAYRCTPSSGRLALAGTDPLPLAPAAARLARESIRGQLLRAGWAVLHASAVVCEDDLATVLTFGDKGAGKTTTALLLATHGWQLLANDRVLVRPVGERGVAVLPWPSAAALGLGLLHALGWDAIARGHLRAGGNFHPTQHASVTAALLAGSHAPLWDGKGKERKVQVFPDQFPALFDVPLAPEGGPVPCCSPRSMPTRRPTSSTGPGRWERRTSCPVPRRTVTRTFSSGPRSSMVAAGRAFVWRWRLVSPRCRITLSGSATTSRPAPPCWARSPTRRAD